jgi:cation diffusion facilitator CzcD-associated flavoprotein CzcO
MPDAMVAARASEATSGGTTQQVDVAVVGAGFAGLYLLHRLRKAGDLASVERSNATE